MFKLCVFCGIIGLSFFLFPNQITNVIQELVIFSAFVCGLIVSFLGDIGLIAALTLFGFLFALLK